MRTLTLLLLGLAALLSPAEASAQYCVDCTPHAECSDDYSIGFLDCDPPSGLFDPCLVGGCCDAIGSGSCDDEYGDPEIVTIQADSHAWSDYLASIAYAWSMDGTVSSQVASQRIIHSPDLAGEGFTIRTCAGEIVSRRYTVMAAQAIREQTHEIII